MKRHKVPKTPTDLWEYRTGQKAIYAVRVEKRPGVYAWVSGRSWCTVVHKGKSVTIKLGPGKIINQSKVRQSLSVRKQSARLKKRRNRKR